MTTKALYLDRDGVINEDYGHVFKKENFKFKPGIFELTKQAMINKYKIIIITNQAGIGRGYYTENDFKKLNIWMCKQFEKKGISIEKVYYSPFHPTHGIGKYLKDDDSRKPKPGMILQSVKDMQINLRASILIGDKQTDIQAGLTAGVGVNILLSENKTKSIVAAGVQIIETLHEAIPQLVRDNI